MSAVAAVAVLPFLALPAAATAPVEVQATESKSGIGTFISILFGDGTKVEIQSNGGEPTIVADGKTVTPSKAPSKEAIPAASVTPSAAPTPAADEDTQDDEIADQQTAQDAPAGAEAIEAEIFAATNKYRAANDLPELKRSTCLDETAGEHSEVMIGQLEEIEANDGKGDIEHADLDKVEQKCDEIAAENIAAQQPTVTEVMDDWKSSPGHDKNLRGDFDLIGIGVTEDDDGKITYVQQFGKSKALVTAG